MVLQACVHAASGIRFLLPDLSVVQAPPLLFFPLLFDEYPNVVDGVLRDRDLSNPLPPLAQRLAHFIHVLIAITRYRELYLDLSSRSLQSVGINRFPTVELWLAF